MRDGMKLMRKIGATPALQSVVASELSPGSDVNSDQEFDEFVRKNSWTVYHQCGTCRMGTDPKRSVVDEQLRVHGVQGLRVVMHLYFLQYQLGILMGQLSPLRRRLLL